MTTKNRIEGRQIDLLDAYKHAASTDKIKPKYIKRQRDRTASVEIVKKEATKKRRLLKAQSSQKKKRKKE